MDIRRMLAEALLSMQSDAIVAADKQGIIVFWNPGAERIFGYSSVEAVGRSLDIIIPERLRARHWRGYQQVMDGGESRYGHGDLLAVPGMTKDGRSISLEFTIAPLRSDSGALVGFAAILRDITKRFEEARDLKRRLAEASGRLQASGN